MNRPSRMRLLRVNASHEHVAKLGKGITYDLLVARSIHVAAVYETAIVVVVAVVAVVVVGGGGGAGGVVVSETW